MSILDCKERTRKFALQARDAIPPEEKIEAAKKISALFLEAVKLNPASIVAGYWPVRGEADPMPLMRALAQQGHSLALPHTPEKGNPLIFRAWAENAETIVGKFGIREPLPTAQEVIPDVLLIPMVAFQLSEDEEGIRLGNGGGYYDRTLPKLRQNRTVLAVGLAFAAQKVGNVFAEKHDIRMDLIVTEARVYDFRRLAL